MSASRISVDHVGITVPDLDEAIAFFVDALGFVEVFRSGPYDDFGYVWPGNDGPEKASLRLAVLRLGDSDNVELLEYTQRAVLDDRPAPQPADRGGMHLALHVEDVYGLGEQLSSRADVTVLAPVQVEHGGPLDGLVWSYFLTSFGVVVELIKWDTGLPYEANTSERMALPPWRRLSSVV